jgi:hypothetical protein
MIIRGTEHWTSWNRIPNTEVFHVTTYTGDRMKGEEFGGKN